MLRFCLIVGCKRGILLFYTYLFVRIATCPPLPKAFVSPPRVPDSVRKAARILPFSSAMSPPSPQGRLPQNRFPAAPVLVAKAMLAERPAARAVVINSGQANACTGDEGMRNCRTTQELVAGALGLEASDILPASTGVIGAQLKMDLWEKAAPALAANLGKATPEDFAKAIMTTDAFHKISHREVSLPGGVVKLVAWPRALA